MTDAQAFDLIEANGDAIDAGYLPILSDEDEALLRARLGLRPVDPERRGMRRFLGIVDPTGPRVLT